MSGQCSGLRLEQLSGYGAILRLVGVMQMVHWESPSSEDRFPPSRQVVLGQKKRAEDHCSRGPCSLLPPSPSLPGACVAYFLTKRREYRNSLNPFKGLKEKEEKKLRSRRYRVGF